MNGGVTICGTELWWGGTFVTRRRGGGGALFVYLEKEKSWNGKNKFSYV